MKAALFVFLGGGFGSLARYLVSFFLNHEKNLLPWGTFLVNILGSLIIGVLMGWILKQQTHNAFWILFLGVGFCGGFTTFSSFAYENQVLLKEGQLLTFFLYTAGSLILGLAAVYLGIALSRWF
ncbi:fluoride efflux transporter CrcB [Croceiramulus getboli]|nr:fluoride efflux transporter CrcB [Flavobacteriaceae bacterium YJPT1-3]